MTVLPLGKDLPLDAVPWLTKAQRKAKKWSEKRKRREMGQKLADKCQLATDSEINPLSNHRETKRETRRGSICEISLFLENISGNPLPPAPVWTHYSLVLLFILGFLIILWVNSLFSLVLCISLSYLFSYSFINSCGKTFVACLI